MTTRKLAAALAATALAATAAHAQSTQDLRDAVLKAQQAAAEAQAAAQKAELALKAAQDAQAAQAKAAGIPGAITYKQGEGATYNGPLGSVTLYGLIDVSYVYTNHADKAGNSLFAPRVAWFSGNRWGLAGSRPLGNTGLNAIFRLESEFESQTGDMDTPGVLFNRDSWVGVESKAFGKLTLGRQNALGRDPAASAIYENPYNQAVPNLEEGGGTNNNDYKQLIFYAGTPTGTRVDNGVTWKKSFDSGLVTGLQYMFGGVAGDSSRNTSTTASLAYAGGAFNLGGFATHANVNGQSNQSYSVGGNYLTGPFRVNAGYYWYKADQAALGRRSDRAYTISGKYAPHGPFDYELGYQVMRADNAAVSGAGNVLNAFADATAATATATGHRTNVYGSVFYHFDKITELYLAADRINLYDGYKFGATHGFRNQNEVAVGMRTRF